MEALTELPAKILYTNWRDLDNDKIRNPLLLLALTRGESYSSHRVIPIGRSRDCSPLCSHRQRVDLGRIKPRNT
jgi:hypothetical protein